METITPQSNPLGSTASLMGSGINGNPVTPSSVKIKVITASLMGSGINGNNFLPVELSGIEIMILYRFPYGKWN